MKMNKLAFCSVIVGATLAGFASSAQAAVRTFAFTATVDYLSSAQGPRADGLAPGTCSSTATRSRAASRSTMRP